MIVKSLSCFSSADIALLYEAKEMLRTGRAHEALGLLDTALCVPDPAQPKKYEAWRIDRFRAAPPLIPYEKAAS